MSCAVCAVCALDGARVEAYFRDTKRPTEAHSVRGAMATQTCYKRDLDRLNDVAVVAVAV